MHFKKLPNLVTFMPTCSVNIQPDSVTAEPPVQVLQDLEESFAVAACGLNHSCASQERRYPSGDIQPFLMLASRRDLQPFSNKRPTATKPRMHSKAAFVLKNNGFFRPQRFEFFLGPSRISSRPLPLPGDKYDWLVSADTRVDASSTEPDGPSALSRTDAVDESPRWGRPIGHGSIRISGETPLGEVLAAQRPLASSAPDGRAAFSGSGLLRHLCSPLASSGLHSFGSGPELPKSSPVAAPPVLKGGWLSSGRSKHLELSRPRTATALWMPLLCLREEFSYPQDNIKQG
jgi:hypothetical protein